MFTGVASLQFRLDPPLADRTEGAMGAWLTTSAHEYVSDPLIGRQDHLGKKSQDDT